MHKLLRPLIAFALLAMAIVCMPFASFANTSPDPPGFCANVSNDVGNCLTGKMICADQGSNTSNDAAFATNTGPELGLDGASFAQHIVWATSPDNAIEASTPGATNSTFNNYMNGTATARAAPDQFALSWYRNCASVTAGTVNNAGQYAMQEAMHKHHAGKGEASIVNLLVENPGAIATNANRATYWLRI